MRTLLAKCCVLALIAGGFAFTGDAGRVFARGRRVLESTTLPRQAAEPTAESTVVSEAIEAVPTPPPAPDQVAVADASPAAPAPASVGGESASPGPTAAPPAPTRPAVPPADAPIGDGSAASPPVSSPDSIDLATLSPGDRVVIWIGRRGGRKGATGSLTIAMDVIDPASAEVLEQRHAAGGDQGANHAPFRRIRILGSATEGLLGGVIPTGPSGRITRRQSLRIVPVDRSLPGRDPSAVEAIQGIVETIGPVQAMAVTRATTTVP